MEKELWEACSEGDYAKFQNLIKEEKININSTNKDGQRLFNTICDAVSCGKLAPDFYFEILKRKDLEINFQDEKNPAAVVTLCTTQKENGSMASESHKYKFNTEEYRQEQKLWDEKVKYIWAVKTDMLKALLEREDFNTNAVYLISEKSMQSNSLFREYNTPIGIVLDKCSFQKSMLETLVESEKFDLNDVSYRALQFSNNGKKHYYEQEVITGHKEPRNILEHACENEDVEAAEYLMDHGAKATNNAIEILADLTREDENLYYKSENLNNRMKSDVNLQK